MSRPILPDGSARAEEAVAAERRAANGSKIWSVLLAMHPTRFDFDESGFGSPGSTL
jgi:hypothetical protein